jgi:geranylgeranyl reductase family protein
MERFDAIVVGAGPAGSVTAYLLARAGAKTLLLDRARFPRDKPCGGGLTVRAVRELPVDPAPVVEDSVDTFELGLDYRRRVERKSSEPLVLMTQRRRLDGFLAEQAASAGADFRDGQKVTGISLEENGVRLNGVRASFLVGADGANGVTAKALDVGGLRGHGVALEGNSPGRDGFAGRALVQLGSVPGGYAWIFPKGDHVNVGVGGWDHQGPRLREHLARLCAAYRIDESKLTDVRGHRLPMRAPGSRLARGRALLVGDAAGLIDPLSGDGMYEAFVSARLAAKAVLENRIENYERELDAELTRTLAASWKAKLAFDRFPRLTYTIARAPLVWPFFEAFVRGDVHEPADARGPVRAPLRLVEALSKLS